MSDKTTPETSTHQDALIKQTLTALTHVKHDQKELLEGVRNTLADGQLPVHQPIIDKLTDIFCKTSSETVASLATECLYEAAASRSGQPYIIQNMFQMTQHSLETGNEEMACKIIRDVVSLIKKKMDWADLDINDQFQALKDTKVKRKPDETPVDTMDRIRKSLLKGASVLFNAKAAPENKLQNSLEYLQLAFDEVLIEQFNQAIDKNENAKGFVSRMRNKVRKFKNNFWV